MKRIIPFSSLIVLSLLILLISKTSVLAAGPCTIENPTSALDTQTFEVIVKGDYGSDINWNLSTYPTASHLADQKGSLPQVFPIKLPAGSHSFLAVGTQVGSTGIKGGVVATCVSSHNTLVTDTGTSTSSLPLCWSIAPGEGSVRLCYNKCNSNQTGLYTSKEECEENLPAGKEGDACNPTKAGSCGSGLECWQTFGDNGVCVSSKKSTTTEAPNVKCVKGLNNKGYETCLKVGTGLGTQLATDPIGFIKSIFGLLLGVSGGIAVILIIASGYRLMASQGNPEQVQGAREMLTSAIVGLLFIIFSLVILQIIGVDILQIPGFE